MSKMDNHRKIEVIHIQKEFMDFKDRHKADRKVYYLVRKKH